MRHPESQYLDMLARVLESGDPRVDRTGVGTLSLFGEMARFDLSSGQVPILTTKKVFWKTAVKEMLWFLTGGTNIRELLQDNVRIWTDWPLQKYRQATGSNLSQADFEQRVLDDEAFAAQWGELGPVYGKQWRAWDGPDGPIDQIRWVLDEIRRNPDSRRLMVVAYNPTFVDEMALPPCHSLFQFYVANGKLSCQLYQRSADTFLGVPFNIASYALLTHMIAQQCDLAVGDFVWTGGDTHLYLNHLEQVQTQLARTPYPLPQLNIKRRPPTLFDYKFEDFEIVNYQSHPHISAPVAV